ncbi:hypothetical protein ACTHPF_08535 [Paenibacillus sp. SAF-054]|uniref:hypothetical protein n=1 Tax=unclassified Paenibacillus TaxID=185978 RepID=UPI003F7EF07D
MNKRPSRFELYSSLLLILALAAIAAAFLSGVRVGAGRMEEKYTYLKLSSAAPDFSDSYQQQDLVTFYHTVFLPYREFKTEWAQLTGSLVVPGTEQSGVFKQLSKLADTKYDEVLQTSVFDASPLLEQSQYNTLKSLRLFSKAADRAAAGDSRPDFAISMLEKDEFYKNAAKYGLLAQKQYYSSMLRWGAKVSPNIPKQYVVPASLQLDTWTSYPLMVKNEAVASTMLSSSFFSAADPQDITACIDSWIITGKAKAHKLTTLQQAVSYLRQKEIVQPAAFIKLKKQYGTNELLPQLPFFFELQNDNI